MENLTELIKQRDEMVASLDQGMREIENTRQEGNLPLAWEFEATWEKRYSRFLSLLDVIAGLTGEPVERYWPVAE